MSTFPEPLLIDVSTIVREALERPSCPSCSSELSVLITGRIAGPEAEWEISRSHEMTCPSLPPELRAQCVADDTDQ